MEFEPGLFVKMNDGETVLVLIADKLSRGIFTGFSKDKVVKKYNIKNIAGVSFDIEFPTRFIQCNCTLEK